ncbi:hypothetical protein BTT_47910 [Bacillus thuringiensis serovar morrisoni str. 4AA1]|nr:hypothetical protein BTT_47910 [Bacillus thuringiensis serovar morrisoni str. 4AA1]
MNKAKLIQSKIEEGKLSVNELRILMDLEPIEAESCNRLLANNKLIIEVTADTSEALEGIKEVTEAANECVEALEKLEKAMGKFKGKAEPVEVSFDIKTIAQSTLEQTADFIKLQANKLDIKRSDRYHSL